MSTADPLPPGASGLASLLVEDLVERAVEDTVRLAAPNPGRSLITELQRRSDHTVWEGVLVLLGPLAARPVYCLPEPEGTDRLRRNARGTPDTVTALVLTVMASYRDNGAQSAHEAWRRAPVEVRRTAVLQLLITYCSSIGSQAGRLSPAQTVSLIRRAIPVTC